MLQALADDHRAAIAALLREVAALAADDGLSVSRDYVRRSTSLALALTVRRHQGE